ncbi:PREDICTED: protein POLAR LOCALIZATION DURING ASYMMETRIC DIVISION AND REDISTRIBUTION-like isoform X2 [Nelumbo nucifera]|uniref:Protein POLAR LOCALIZATION DURING ASYMMETRIC DIVISION AND REDISTRIBUTION-like isoform X2 n=1 Tax=Nelumbo nucifera TaxID=4432 RepID=A0A1U8B4J5_NELNU|nr:PREDICTED: protein POLAR LOCALIZATION DURING ASYMMETRIC DIVISION AND REDISTRIBUTION-like isoform X2 [Nelumbo nucifera]
MQIIDILNRGDYDTDDEYDGEMTRKREHVVCFLPTGIVSRWLSLLKREPKGPNSGSKRRFPSSKAEEKNREIEWCRRGKEIEREEVGQSLTLCCSSDGAKGESSSSTIAEETAGASNVVAPLGKHMKDLSFNLGLGVGLAFLVAATKNEYCKMMELQAQMEMLLKEAKDGLCLRDVISKQSDPHDNVPCFTEESHDGGKTDYHLSVQNCASFQHLVDSEITMECDEFSKCDTPTGEGIVGMEKLGAELESELELMQINLDTGVFMRHPQEQLREGDDDTVPSGSQSTSFIEVDNLQDADTEDYYGVSPTELERKLHELLEERQQERIAELEFALECTMHKLREKEMEVSWWKDTAQLLSQHVPVATCLSSQVPWFQRAITSRKS